MNIAEAKAKLSELVARAESGEEVLIARDGMPVVSLAPRQRPLGRPRTLGQWDHLGLNIPDTVFFDPDPEIETWFQEWKGDSIVETR
ncbi:MAG: type II toxin-antitoxin system prevent-host-death family antitoxin [Caulobacteraceae bacterium]